MFKVNKKNIRALFISIVDFKQVNFSWAMVDREKDVR